MVQILPPRQLSGFGQLMGGVGEGLSSQLPKEIERQRLAHGLRQLQGKQGLNQAEQFTESLSIPGLLENPAALTAFGKILREQAARQGAFNRPPGGARRGKEEPLIQPIKKGKEATFDQYQGAANQPSMQPALSEYKAYEPTEQQTIAPSEGQKAVSPGIYPLYGEESPFERGPFIQKTPEQIQERVNELLRADPYMQEDQARKLVAQEEEQREKNWRTGAVAQLEKKGIKVSIIDEFNKALETVFQKEGPQIYKDITGRYKYKLQNELLDHLLRQKGIDTTKAVQKYTKEAERFAKNLDNFNKTANSWNLGGFNYPSLKAMGEYFESIGESRDFRDMIEEKYWMSPYLASSFAYSTSPNVKKAIKNITPNMYTSPQKMVDNVIDSLSPKDSILNISYQLSKKTGLPNLLFMNEFRKHKDKLNEDQQDDLGARNTDISDWGDLGYQFSIGRYFQGEK